MLWVVAALAVILLILFLRGDEDSWIKDSNGRWIRHGNPEGDAPLDASVSDFASCAKLYPVMETYPEQCRAPDGRTFIKSY